MIFLIACCCVALFFLCYILNRISCGRTESVRCLTGKTAIITGGNSGVGYQICLNLASRGCKVIIADKDDSENSRKRIIELTKNPNIISKHLNLASFKSIRNFANDVNETEGRLDILVNNAGVLISSPEPTEDGLDLAMQVNYFGPFLLTHLLTDLLKKSAPSRIIFTSSCIAFLGDSNLNDTFLTTLNSYTNSKLATIMASDIFAKKLKSAGVTSNSLHPGLIRTNLYKKLERDGIIGWILVWMFNACHFFFGKTVWEGAQTTTHLAVSEELDDVTGEHFWDCRRFIKPRMAYNERQCRNIWELSENSVKLLPHEKI